MVRVKGQKTEGSCQRKFSANSFGAERGVERCQSMCSNVKSQGEEVHGTGDKVQKTSVFT